MEKKFTPGPWKIHPQASLVVTTLDDQTICSTGNASKISLDEQQANAHLISAAPELLDSLIQMVNMWDSAILAFPVLQHQQQYRDAKSAIAKALGQTQEESNSTKQ